MITWLGALVKRSRGEWWRRQGGQVLVTTFWPQDYRRGTTVRIGDQDYRISRYVRAADPRYFEVWGRAVTQTTTTMLDTQRAPMPQGGERLAA